MSASRTAAGRAPAATAGDRRDDEFRADEIIRPVGGEDEQVAGRQGLRPLIDLDAVRETRRAAETGSSGGNGYGMVDGQLFERRAGHATDAAVAHMKNRCAEAPFRINAPSVQT